MKYSLECGKYKFVFNWKSNLHLITSFKKKTNFTFFGIPMHESVPFASSQMHFYRKDFIRNALQEQYRIPNFKLIVGFGAKWDCFFQCSENQVEWDECVLKMK